MRILAVSYIDKITYLANRGDDDVNKSIHYQKPLPNTCPVCQFAIVPKYILLHKKSNKESELLCGCPREECGSLFFAVYESKLEAVVNQELKRLYPYTKVKKYFPEEVIDLSPNFVSIYNQAHHAEQEQLDLICGVGYRKALEYLIKDYVLKSYPEDRNKIKVMPLQQCIQRFIAEPTIKLMAERATWVGNDETHYVRQWEGKDLQDLKNLIDLTVYFISMSLKAFKYQQEMVR